MLARIRSFVGAALLAGLAVSCASDEETAAYRGAPVCRYTVPEAMQTYARAVARSSRTEEEAGPLAPGAYRLDWAAARISIDSSLYSADVPIEMAYAYGRYRPGAADSAAIAPVYAAMVTVRNPASDGSSCYLRFYVPDDDHLAAHGPSDYANNTIHLQNHDKYGYRDYVLLEELIHCYQRENRPNNGAPVPKLNDEIEAKVGWLLYLERNGRSLTPQQATAQLGFGHNKVNMLANYVGGFGAVANRSDNPVLYDDLYMDARDALTVKYQGYYFSEKRDDWEMENLRNLLKDC